LNRLETAAMLLLHGPPKGPSPATSSLIRPCSNYHYRPGPIRGAGAQP
jgi:hypothetical protein